MDVNDEESEVSEGDEESKSIADDGEVVKLVKEAKVVYDDQGGMLMTSVFEQGPESSFSRQKPRSFACKENGCTKKYKSNRSLKSHMAVKHGCDLCGGSCANKVLKKHKTKVYGKKDAPLNVQRKPHKDDNFCSICGDRNYKTKNTCKEHCAVVHQGKRYECGKDGCRKILKSRASLYCHQATHSKLYECFEEFDGCNKKFSMLYQLETHIKLKHLNMELFVCKYCNSVKSNKSCLVRHERVRHSMTRRTRPSQRTANSAEKAYDQVSTPSNHPPETGEKSKKDVLDEFWGSNTDNTKECSFMTEEDRIQFENDISDICKL